MTLVHTVIPIFSQKVECGECRLDISYKYLYTKLIMDKETLLVSLFFMFMIGAGVGFYLARMMY